MDKDDLFASKLEQIQNGISFEACAGDLPAEEAELLLLAGQLRDMACPEPDPAMVRAQRERVLRLAQKEVKMSSQGSLQKTPPTSQGLPGRIWPVVLAGGVILVFVCVLVIGGATGLWLSAKHKNRVVLQTPPSSPAESMASVPTVTPTAPTVSVTAAPASSATVPAAVTPTQAVPLIVEPVKIPNAQTARVDALHGLVQVQTDPAGWLAVPPEGQLVRVGQRVRTGALSAANLVFYDGSTVTLGPDAEISLDQLDARSAGSPRVIVLTQWTGKATHQVVPSTAEGSRYQVNTPAGSGTAQGTKFDVSVTPQLVRFDIDEGQVAVTHASVTVVGIAGQTIHVSPNTPPAQPLLRITGEGQVTRTGETWEIAGQAFQISDQTVIIGNPQMGDWVRVEGHFLTDETRVADLIIMLWRSPENKFTLQGQVESIGKEAWVVAGQTISITAQTVIEEGIVEGDRVLVRGHIEAQGRWVAEQITALEEQPGWPFEFTGVVQSMGDHAWTVSGIVVTVDQKTGIDDDLKIGDLVRVKGMVLPDGVWQATGIRLALGEMAFEFIGKVESLDPWIVSGVEFTTRSWTEIDAGIALGDRVRVSGQILADGTRVASEIRRIEVWPPTYVEFVGRITGIDPWSINQIPVTLDEETEIKGNVRLGIRVRVKALVLPDGTLLARQIKAVGFAVGQGCLDFSGVIIAVEGDQIKLRNGMVIPLKDVVIVHNDMVGKLVIVAACTDENGRVNVLDLKLIYKFGPTGTPEAMPTTVNGGQVVICHKPGTRAQQTMTVSQEALSAHLAHGDTLGPCK